MDTPRTGKPAQTHLQRRSRRPSAHINQRPISPSPSLPPSGESTPPTVVTDNDDDGDDPVEVDNLDLTAIGIPASEWLGPKDIKPMTWEQFTSLGVRDSKTILAGKPDDVGEIPRTVKIFFAEMAVATGARIVGDLADLGKPKPKGKGKGKGGRKRPASEMEGEAQEGDEEDEADEDENDGPPAKRRAQHKWSAILTKKAFPVPQPLLDHVKLFGINAIDFLCEPAIGEDIQAASTWRQHLGARFDYIIDVEHRINGIDPGRRVAGWLFIRDAVKLVDPRASTLRPTEETLNAVTKLLDNISWGRPSVDRKDAANKIWEFFRFGEKIHHLNHEFGNGAMLVLCEKLSADFLRHKSPPTESRALAYHHLRSTDFQTAAQLMTPLGNSIRAAMIRPIRDGFEQTGLLSELHSREHEFDDDHECEGDPEYQPRQDTKAKAWVMKRMFAGPAQAKSKKQKVTPNPDNETDGEGAAVVAVETSPRTSTTASGGGWGSWFKRKTGAA